MVWWRFKHRVPGGVGLTYLFGTSAQLFKLMEVVDAASFEQVTNAGLLDRLGSLRDGAEVDDVPCHWLPDILGRVAARMQAGEPIVIVSD